MNINTEKYISRLIQYQIIEEDNKEIYMYGLECYILKIIHIGIFLSIGLLTDTFLNTIIFLIAYSLLRTYAGGYHANSLRKCFLFSIIISITVVLTSYFLARIEVPNIYNISLLIISLFVVGKFAPADTEKKRHDLLEKKVYKRKVNVILIICILLIIVSRLIKLYWVADAITLGIVIEAVMIIIQLCYEGTTLYINKFYGRRNSL